ncbi:MAG: helix-turn-helix domain-containing protein [Pseudochelatococcus sp.]|uniref:helix-turn-helix domain-containing protein n=1 Tax=Pseudochelatococcus sp. TaxID=2020869 RepID=UPI003D8B4516
MEKHLSGTSALGPEKLLTTQEAAQALGVHVWQIRRAVKRGDIPSFTPFNSRRLVKLSEVIAYIESCRQGGGDER